MRGTTKLPHHLAIIMDGNGRWAELRRKPRAYGHIKGTRVAKKIITECSRLGVKWLTMYAFSTENWFRPQMEVNLLLRILRRYLEKETGNLIKENIRLTVIGETDRLPADLRKSLEASIKATENCTGLRLVFALSYGSRQEITSAVKNIAKMVQDGQISPEKINEDLIGKSLWTFPAPDPDLIIRTSGEERLSNFLLWQAAYSEFHFTDTLWPDFDRHELIEALNDFSSRQRRFGRVMNNDEHIHDPST
jgi:undecaprenyl diphosphate synthase